MSGELLPRRGLQRLFERGVLARLALLREGEVTLVEGGTRRTFGAATAAFPLRATLTLRDPEFFAAVALGGSIGAGEAYMDGRFEVDDLPALIRIFARNRAVTEQVEGGLARLALPFLRWWHARRSNTAAGSRRNIAAHYDLGNDFFALFLDPTMTYSCGLFERESATLEEASLAKIDRLCRLLQLQPGERLLEIGTGWGAFAIHAARHYGVHVTTTTISQEQQRFAAERIAAAGLGERVTLLLEDYRALRGRFDKLVSVEMIEAVGWQYFGTFFRKIGELLEPHGAAAIQAIVIADQHFESARRSVDFIQRHIFPGSCIPSVTALCAAATASSDLRLVHLDDLTPHYARTLREWRTRFLARRDDVLRLGRSAEFVRAWEWYFAYCEGGFAERVIGDVQMRFDRPLCRAAPLLPPLPPPVSPRVAADGEGGA